MENMRTILMYPYPQRFFGVNISGNMFPLINDKAFPSPSPHLFCKNCAKQPGTYYQIIVMHDVIPFALILQLIFF